MQENGIIIQHATSDPDVIIAIILKPNVLQFTRYTHQTYQTRQFNF